MITEYEKGISFALKDIDKELARRLIPTLIEYIDKAGLTDGRWEAIVPNVSLRGGGEAFQWEDVLAIGDITDMVGDLIGGLTPLECAKMIVCMLKLLRRKCGVTVLLGQDEFKVLRAIKRGCSNIADIAEYTGLTTKCVESVVSDLQTRMYKKEIPLVVKTTAGIETDF